MSEHYHRVVSSVLLLIWYKSHIAIPILVYTRTYVCTTYVLKTTCLCAKQIRSCSPYYVVLSLCCATILLNIEIFFSPQLFPSLIPAIFLFVSEQRLQWKICIEYCRLHFIPWMCWSLSFVYAAISVCTLYIQKRCDVLKNTETLCFKSKSKAKRKRRQKANIAAVIHGTFHTGFGISLFPLSLITPQQQRLANFLFSIMHTTFLRLNLCRKEGNRNIPIRDCV